MFNSRGVQPDIIYNSKEDYQPTEEVKANIVTEMYYKIKNQFKLLDNRKLSDTEKKETLNSLAANIEQAFRRVYLPLPQDSKDFITSSNEGLEGIDQNNKVTITIPKKQSYLQTNIHGVAFLKEAVFRREVSLVYFLLTTKFFTNFDTKALIPVEDNMVDNDYINELLNKDYLGEGYKIALMLRCAYWAQTKNLRFDQGNLQLREIIVVWLLNSTKKLHSLPDGNFKEWFTLNLREVSKEYFKNLSLIKDASPLLEKKVGILINAEQITQLMADVKSINATPHLNEQDRGELLRVLYQLRAESADNPNQIGAATILIEFENSIETITAEASSGKDLMEQLKTKIKLHRFQEDISDLSKLNFILNDAIIKWSEIYHNAWWRSNTAEKLSDAINRVLDYLPFMIKFSSGKIVCTLNNENDKFSLDYYFSSIRDLEKNKLYQSNNKLSSPKIDEEVSGFSTIILNKADYVDSMKDQASSSPKLGGSKSN